MNSCDTTLSGATSKNGADAAAFIQKAVFARWGFWYSRHIGPWRCATGSKPGFSVLRHRLTGFRGFPRRRCSACELQRLPYDCGQPQPSKEQGDRSSSCVPPRIDSTGGPYKEVSALRMLATL